MNRIEINNKLNANMHKEIANIDVYMSVWESVFEGSFII